jgi:hypothetical protein
MTADVKSSSASGEVNAIVIGADVNLHVKVRESGAVRCTLSCNGQTAVITFNHGDVSLDISESH